MYIYVCIYTHTHTVVYTYYIFFIHSSIDEHLGSWLGIKPHPRVDFSFPRCKSGISPQMQEAHFTMIRRILLKLTLLGLEWDRTDPDSPLKDLQQLPSKKLISKLPFSSHSYAFSYILSLVGTFQEVWKCFSLTSFENLCMEIWPWNFASILSFSFLETSFLFYSFFSDEAVYLFIYYFLKPQF